MVVNERMANSDKKKVIKKRKRKSNEVVKVDDIPNDLGDKANKESKDTKENVKESIESEIKRKKLTEANHQYPILKDEQLVRKLQSVPMTNNQKGRIRQVLRDSLKGTSEILAPEVIHNRIQAILKGSEKHTDSDLRKMRILYNMLKTALKTDVTKSEKDIDKDKSKKVLKKKKKVKLITDLKEEKDIVTNPIGEGTKKQDNENVQKVKGPKRYVVFVGNLPLDIDKEKIKQHFSEIKDFIKDIRLPKQKEGKKSAIAYVEVENEMTYELALSKHHSMLGNKRINVLYTAQKNGKVSKTEAKSKSAKLVALQKSGKLIGSLPLKKKRSHRRMIMKQAQAKLAVISA
ncbi:uncharacterized protein PF3D7_1120000-like [Battus philenor]|uniref:uncharacterized protein PF3D7_1120000-like n=1 Tax=Battus philenor TaxID=42288 RepID=UPI0035CE9497